MATILLLQLGADRGSLVFIAQIALFIGIFYFLLIRPQRAEQKRHRELVASLKRGDRVATVGGIIGEIVALNEEAVTLKTGSAQVVVERAKVARLAGGAPAAAAAEK
ncbi:MAG TPA: preprotein translocase subunit YajC [Longimicrobiaceae bacterium]|nr:preprotein translocase subunit YajC [Longimicrobiaceae bacterium]